MRQLDVSTTAPSIADADWLTLSETQAVLGMLADAGHRARIVGGAVRNELLGLPVVDIDIATTALPAEVMRLAARAGFGVAPTGLQHGTVMVIVNHRSYEVTTLRIDVATDGRHATVAFTDDWAADAARRDFTINALYADADGDVVDPVGGYRDIVGRRVRFIGDPGARIAEDYLRVLRFFRFFATHETAAQPDAAGLAACVAEQAGLDRISAERIQVELLKTLAGANVIAAVTALAETGILERVTGSVPRVAILERLVAIERGVGRAPDAILRLGCLLVGTTDHAGQLARRLRLSSSERRVLTDVARGITSPMLDEVAPTNDRQARRALYAAGPERYAISLLAAWANGPAAIDDARLRDMLSLPDRWPMPVMPVDGAALIARGLPPGPSLGAVLGEIEAWWVGEDFPTDAAAIEAVTDTAVDRVQSQG